MVATQLGETPEFNEILLKKKIFFDATSYSPGDLEAIHNSYSQRRMMKGLVNTGRYGCCYM